MFLFRGVVVVNHEVVPYLLKCVAYENQGLSNDFASWQIQTAPGRKNPTLILCQTTSWCRVITEKYFFCKRQHAPTGILKFCVHFFCVFQISGRCSHEVHTKVDKDQNLVENEQKVPATSKHTTYAKRKTTLKLQYSLTQYSLNY